MLIPFLAHKNSKCVIKFKYSNYTQYKLVRVIILLYRSIKNVSIELLI